MDDFNCLNVIGLLFDIIGVSLLFFYENPKPEQGAILLESAPNIESRTKRRSIYRTVSRIGLALLLIGFIFQLISNF